VAARGAPIKRTVKTTDPDSRFASERGRLWIVLLITITYFVAELAGGFYANSLALLTDAVHMFTDIAALCLSLLTLWISSRPATADKTYGYLRAEILGALFNGLFLWMLVAFIWFEAAQRLSNPPQVLAPAVMAIALAGMVVNGVSAFLTFGNALGGRAGMAQRAVFLHVLSDLIGCIGVLIAGGTIYFTGWRAADPVVSFFIGGLIIYSSWGLIREGVDILMESVPATIDLDQLRNDLLAVRGTREVHDLHVWCLSAHAVLAADADHDTVLAEMAAMIEHNFNIRHITVQLERDSRREREHQHF
jgi:cobalt-zinc-cadmium efflux system protein